MKRFLGLVILALVGCASPPKERVVLLPGPEGKVGAVTVTTKEGERTLSSAYAGAEIGRAGKIVTVTETEASVRTRFGTVLDARPQRPVSLVLYFLRDSDKLAPASLPVIAELKAELKKRPAPEIGVIGHTDRVGTVDQNDKLSLKRAEAMRAVLIGEGIPATAIEISGRGERQPLVATADEVAEPRNRRVEINVR
jgi:outer membrane protein OmpA-like peptidoglycan-associated protein